jgi:hypothetical protein
MEDERLVRTNQAAWEPLQANPEAFLPLEAAGTRAMVAAIVFVLFFDALRISLRWYGEKHLGVYSVHIREQLCRAYQAFFETAS